MGGATLLGKGCNKKPPAYARGRRAGYGSRTRLTALGRLGTADIPIPQHPKSYSRDGRTQDPFSVRPAAPGTVFRRGCYRPQPCSVYSPEVPMRQLIAAGLLAAL